MANIITVDSLKGELAKQHMKTLNNFFANDEKKTLKFLSAVAYCAQSTPKLLECSQESIIQAFMKCAEYNLFPSSVRGEVYILPYSNKGKMEAQFQLGYKGIIALLARAGISVYTDIVKVNDTCKITSGMHQNIFHEYPLTLRGDAIGVYAIATYEGEKVIKYMSKDEVLEFKKFSKSAGGQYGDAYSPWNQKNDPELNMWRKTVIKQIAKNLSLTEEAYKAIAVDNEEASIEDYHQNKLLEQAKRPTETTASELLMGVGTSTSQVPTSMSVPKEAPENTETQESDQTQNDLPTSGE